MNRRPVPRRVPPRYRKVAIRGATSEELAVKLARALNLLEKRGHRVKTWVVRRSREVIFIAERVDP